MLHLLLLLGISGSNNTLSKTLLSTSNLTMASGSGLNTTSLKLVSNSLGTKLLCLLVVDGLNENTLVLVHITLDSKIQLAIQMEVNLLAISVLLQKTAQHTEATHPENLCWQTSLTGSSALTVSAVTSLGLGLSRSTSTGS